MNRNAHLIVGALVASLVPAMTAPAGDNAELPLDIKPLALECYGLRGAVAVDSSTVVAVLGASATGARNQAKVWRIRSEEDPEYAYEKFVQPVSAQKIPTDVEFALPEKFSAPKAAKNELGRYLVELKLPRPLKQGVRYGLVAHGDGAPVTGAKTGCFFVWDGATVADHEGVRVPADDLAARMVGLRRVSPIGDGKIALEFGASFSSAAWRDPSCYTVRLNGEAVAVSEFGRRSKIDVYLPIGWPYKTILQHDVYLDLGRDLRQGDLVEVSVSEQICSGERKASFKFDEATTISRSIQANQVGYLPDAPKVAYLGFWLGSFPEKVKTSDPFDYTTPPSTAEAYYIPPPPPAEDGQIPDSKSQIPQEPQTPQLSNSTTPNFPTDYDSLAPYALRFHEPPPFELVREKDGSVAFKGAARLSHNGLLADGRANHSAENVYELDFSSLTEPGRYYIRVPGVGRSIAFDIAADVYARAFKAQATGVFAQRCGIELTPDRAPGWRRIACHTNGVQLSTVAHWRHREFGPFRDHPVLAPNPDYRRIAANHKALLEDKALVARFPFDGDFANAVADSAVSIDPIGRGTTFQDDGQLGSKVLRTGRKDNGLAGAFEVNPETGATATFWFRRQDVDGNKLGGDLLRLGPEKGQNISLTAAWGVVKFGRTQWRRLGDNKWRNLAIRIHPADGNGKMRAELLADAAVAATQEFAPPSSTELIVANATDEAAAGCHFSDLRFYSRPLSDVELTNLATRAEETIPQVIPLCGGHHDAGDYNPRCHIDVAQALLSAWEHAPGKFADGQLDIPEAGNGLPDIVDEALWALKPWIALQDDDGGVRSGTESDGDPNFYETVELDPKGDFAYDKDCKASFVFAGTFAQASRVLSACGRKEQAADLLARAKRAYDWGVANVPEGLADLAQFTDYRLASRAYAAAELLHATGEKRFLDDFRECSPWDAIPDAPLRADGRYDAMAAAYAFLRDTSAAERDKTLYDNVKAAVLREADYYIAGSDIMAYKFVRHPMAPISWGTGAYGVHIRPVLAAWFATGDVKYRDWVVRTCDVMLGANPLGLSWIVGLGERTIRAPLHNSRYRPEGVPVNGMQAEGPSGRGQGYNYIDTVYPAHDRAFAIMHAFVDCHFAIAMDEGVVNTQALDMALFGLLLPDAK